MTLSFCLILAVISASDVFLLAVCLLCAFLFVESGKIIFMSLREVKRLANTAISPVVTNVSEAVKGRLLARAMGVPDFFVARHIESCNQYLSVCFKRQLSRYHITPFDVGFVHRFDIDSIQRLHVRNKTWYAFFLF